MGGVSFLPGLPPGPFGWYFQGRLRRLFHSRQSTTFSYTSGLAGFLLHGWLQTKLDAINLKLQAELDRGTHVHRVQFEKEFQIYCEIWDKLVDLLDATLALRPTWDFTDPMEPQEDLQKRRLDALGAAGKAFIEVVRKNRPFYSPGVFCELQKVLELMHNEALDYQDTERKRSEYYREARQNVFKINAAVESACEAIRTRINSLVVS
jgi:hypothetical protein